jgi:2-polyprenyl-3-methyl-5-hydroxy-6-metoxy-1,4-benzoquinol methylase
MPIYVEDCPLCGSGDRVFQSYAEVRGWNYVACGKCGFVFLNPQPTPEELRTYYDSQYQYDPAVYKNTIERQMVWLDYLESALGSSGDLLEIGCSYGYFLNAAKQRGWTVRGVEPGRDATDFARQKLGVNVTKGTIVDLEAKYPSFDAIVAWHVLEHDSNPREFLRITIDLLKPGGVLGLRVPNLESTVSRWAGNTWQWLSPPEHVCMYRKSTLVPLLAEFGLETILCTSARGNARNLWFEVARARAKKLLNGTLAVTGSDHTAASFQPPPRYENRAWYRAIEQLFEVASWPAEAIAKSQREQAGNEAELVVFARKPAGRFA